MIILSFLRKIKGWIEIGKRISSDPYWIKASNLNELEMRQQPKRTEVINYLIRKASLKSYLEIGVRNPADNFNLIECENKISVDPGLEFELNPVKYKMTSDRFFELLRKGELDLNSNHKFGLIFIDGLHVSEQVDRDIENALQFVGENGFLLLHDCNPPTEFHARELFTFHNTPADIYWNGTTWKAFCKYRCNKDFTSVCIDSDWGIGVISKRNLFNNLPENPNPFFEFRLFDENRKEILNLVSYDEFKSLLDEKM